MRGNRSYAFAREGRVRGVQAQLTPMIKTTSPCTSTNAIFATFTLAGQVGDPSIPVLVERWKAMPSMLAKTIRLLRRQGLTTYIRSLEAHESGYPHAHAVLVFNRPFTDLRTNSDGDLLSDRADALLKEVWPHGFTRAVPMTDDGAGGYIMKEVSKYNGAEKNLKNVLKGEYGPGDAKHVLTFALSGMANVRLFATSRDIRFEEQAGDGEPEAELQLDDIENNPTRLGAVLLTRQELYRLLGYYPPPFTEHVDPGSDEFGKIMGLILKRAEAIRTFDAS